MALSKISIIFRSIRNKCVPITKNVTLNYNILEGDKRGDLWNDKMAIVIVTLNQGLQSSDQFIDLMNTLISTSISAEQKQSHLQNQFGLFITGDMKEGVNVMCNYSDLVEEKGIQKGLVEGQKKGLEVGKILAYFDTGMSKEQIAERLHMDVAAVEAVLAENLTLV